VGARGGFGLFSYRPSGFVPSFFSRGLGGSSPYFASAPPPPPPPFTLGFLSVTLLSDTLYRRYPFRARFAPNFAEKKMEFPSQVVSKTYSILFWVKFWPFSNPCRGTSGAVHNESAERTCSCHGLCSKTWDPPLWRWKLFEFQHGKSISESGTNKVTPVAGPIFGPLSTRFNRGISFWRRLDLQILLRS